MLLVLCSDVQKPEDVDNPSAPPVKHHLMCVDPATGNICASHAFNPPEAATCMCCWSSDEPLEDMVAAATAAVDAVVLGKGSESTVD